MNVQQPVREKRSASTLLLLLGGSLIVLALLSALILYIWGRVTLSGGGEQWSDVVSLIYILFGSLPVFGLGLILLLIGLIGRAIRKSRQAALEKPASSED